jgi:hypothetical protein
MAHGEAAGQIRRLSKPFLSLAAYVQIDCLKLLTARA